MNSTNNSRRDFIRKAALTGIVAAGLPNLITSGAPEKKSSRIRLAKGNVILFQGDSITDAGRNKEDESYNNPKILGTGYAMFAAADLLGKHPEADLKIYNRGISGNKVYQLAERWDKDCINLKPDVLSILIGVNDFWHKLNGNYNGTIEIYRNDYNALIERTLKALPGVRLVICEPFAVLGVKAVNEKWFPDFYEYQKAAKELAVKYGAIFVPFQKAFDNAIKKAPASYWTGDGVHASFAGARMMASAWLEATRLG
ncbi:MAG: SGNH/GDSL hydrolase family protein [Bacteroidales bacterium]